jgi:hypothetical protein
VSQRPDDVTAKDSGGGFEPHPEGQFAMVCVDVVNLGYNIETFPGQPPREVPKLALVFVSGERQADENKSLALVTVEMTNSAGEKANLRKFIESWRGKSYTAEQVSEGLPITKLHGQAALISVEHILTRKGRKFAKVRAVSPVPKGVPAPDKALVEEYTRPKFLTDKKQAYADAVAKHRMEVGAQPPELEGEDYLDDSMPF